MPEAISSAIRAAHVEAAWQAEENRRWQEERQKAEDRRRREEAVVRDLDKRLNLWLAATRYRRTRQCRGGHGGRGHCRGTASALAGVAAVLRYARGAGGRSGIAGSRAGSGASVEVLIRANRDASSRHLAPRRPAMTRGESDTNVTQRRLGAASRPPCLVPNLLPELVELAGIEPVTS